ncbi:MAG TPA: FmdB family zinc ribbon protein [Tepidisphaeraceae bacterium]|nr:FmdB family zinc ribbon protein [Tepidisphaeraceae bacterium]
MPTYEYKCDNCGAAFERFQSIMAAPIKRCPECGKAKVRRLIGTGAGLIFKGSGFYITDYRDKSYTDRAKAESGSAGGDAGGSGESKGEAKSEAKSDAKPATEAKPPAKGEAKPASKSDAKPAAGKKKEK